MIQQLFDNSTVSTVVKNSCRDMNFNLVRLVYRDVNHV